MATVPQHPERPDDITARPERPEALESHTPRAERRPRYGQPFFPAVPAGSALYILATVSALVFLALTVKAPLQNPADPLNHEKFNPRPEWYFLFLFQILKYFQGPWEIVGTMIIPGILTIMLLGLPFYDRNWSKRPVRRPFAISAATAFVVGLALLTYIPISQSVQVQSSDLLTAVSPNPKWANIGAIFSQNCQPCHFAANTAGLNLSTYANALKGGNGSYPGLPKKVIIPGNAKGSYLYQVVSWTQKVGASMPFGAAQPISKIDQQNIYNWIQNGAKGP